MSLLRVEALEVRYGDARALDGVGLEVAAGEICAIIGTNGAGKTSLIRAIAGIVPAASGKVAFRGQDITGWPAISSAISASAK